MIITTPGGETVDIGKTENAPTIGIIDYSRRVTNDFGVTTVVPRGFARRMSVRLALPLDAVDGLQRRLADLRATSALWVADSRFQSLSVQGFYKDFTLDLPTSSISYCTLTVEGLAETELLADNGGEAAPGDRPSTLRLIQPIAMTDAALVSSSVPEDDYPQWQAGTTYALGTRVIKMATHRVYESAIAGNIGSDPASADGKWSDIGPTARWASFDQALGTTTTAINEMVIVIDAGAIAGAVALLDLSADAVRVQATGYDRTVEAGAGAVTFLDLPSPTGLVTVTITGGQISVGTLLVGRLVSLGITEAAPSAAITDYSRKAVDDFGAVTVVERAFAKRMTARALIRSEAVDRVFSRLAAVRATPSLWIGQDGRDSLTVYGFFKDFSIEVGEAVSKLSLSIEGLSKAPPQPKPLTSVVAQGSVDGVSWHLGLQPGDELLRISNDSGVTFGEGIRVVGRDGTSAFTAYLTNAQHTLPATFDGRVTSYAGAETIFVIGIGGLDLTDSGQFDLAFPGNPQNLTIVTTGRHFRVTGGFDASEDNASITARLTGKGQYAGVVVDQVFSRSKSKGGANGEPPALLRVAATTQQAKFDTAGNYISGDIIFTATPQNSESAISWAIYDSKGGGHSPGVHTVEGTGAGPVLTLKSASVPGIINYPRSSGQDPNAPQTIRVRAWLADTSGAIFDEITVTLVRDGAKGADAPLIKTQWSINGVDGWHDNFFGADQYYRQSNDNGLNYGPPIRGVGEGGTIGADGTSATHVFRRSPTMPATPGDNTGNPPPGWTDGPPAGADFLWLSKATYRGATQVMPWSAPQRISGADNGSSFTLVDVTNCANPGSNYVIKRGGGEAWNGKAATIERGLNARISGFLRRGTFIGLTGPIPDGDYSSIAYSFHWSTVDAVGFAAYRYGQRVFGVAETGSGMSEATRFSVESRDGFVYYYADSNLFYAHSVNNAAEQLYGVIAIATPGNVVTGINFAINGVGGKDGRDGVNGTNGAPGRDGINGGSAYFHVAYADSADGSVNFTTGAPGARTYLGVAVDQNAADPETFGSYAWSLIKGRDGLNGSDGTPGARGSDGRQSYVHFAYSNSADGSVSFSTDEPAGRAYIGVYSDYTIADSGDYRAYTWSLAKGADGGPGATGAPGTDGFAVSTEAPVFVIPVFPSGAPKPSWQGGAGTIILRKGKSIITAGVGYSLEGAVNMAGLALSGATFSFSGITADTGYFTIVATFEGVQYKARVDAKKVSDGSPAFRGGVTVGGSRATQFSASGQTPVPGGATVRVSVNFNYEAPDPKGRIANFRGRANLYYRNVTDGGNLTLLGTTDGSVATTENVSNIPGEFEYQRTPGSVSAAFTFAAAGADKVYEYSTIITNSAGDTSVVVLGSGDLRLEVIG